METYFDAPMRVVTLNVLTAICERVSGVAHRFWVERATRAGVWVGYSNPTEHGTPRDMFAVFHVFPNNSGYEDDVENPYVVLGHIGRIVDATEDHGDEGWQAFTPVMECAALFRDATTGTWRSEAEVLATNPPS